MPNTVYGRYRKTVEENGVSRIIEKIIYIDDAANGLECHCYCLNCGGRLIAKQGEVREHHFAHAESAECEGGYEVSSIKAVEEILTEAKEIALPGLADKVKAGRIFKYDHVAIIGKSFDSRRHIWSKTVSLETEKAKLCVEILFSGDYRKYRDKYKEQKQSAISINLKELHDFAPDALKEAVLTSAFCKSWVYNEKYQAGEQEIVKDKINQTTHQADKLFAQVNKTKNEKDKTAEDKEQRARYVQLGRERFEKQKKEETGIKSWNNNRICFVCGAPLIMIGAGFNRYYSCSNKCGFNLPVDMRRGVVVYKKKYGDEAIVQLKV